MSSSPSRLRSLAIALLLAVAFAAGFAHPAAAGEGNRLTTSFSLLVGFPDATSANTQGVLLVPGTVLPLDADSRTASDEDSLIERASVLTDLAAKLRRTLRLAEMRVEYPQRIETLTVGERKELWPLPSAPSLVTEVTLLGFNEEVATYRVTFNQGNVNLTSSTVSVARGERAVVGGMDGEQAPYMFLVVEPRTTDAPGNELGPVRVDEGITPPRVVTRSAPEYPASAKAAKITGVVVMETVIEADGTISSVKVLRSPHPDLGDAAVKAVREWRFEPARKDGKPVAVIYNLTINFTLQ